jgi:hypothetical protein
METAAAAEVADGREGEGEAPPPAKRARGDGDGDGGATTAGGGGIDQQQQEQKQHAPPVASAPPPRLLDPRWAAHVASLVLGKYASLPPKGKPQPNEYTVCAGIVACWAPGGAREMAEGKEEQQRRPWHVDPAAAGAGAAAADHEGYTMRCVALGTGEQ